STGIWTVTGPATQLLGQYVITGTVTDDADAAAFSEEITLTNSPPSVSRSSAETVTCDHKTTAASSIMVKNDTGCIFPFEGSAADPNGDPLTYSVRLSPTNKYKLVEGAIDDDSVV